MAGRAVYPAARPRAVEPTPRVADVFERYESSGLLDVPDAIADFFTFSGEPDAIDLQAVGGNVTVVLVDTVGREDSSLIVPSGTTYQTQLRRHKVRAMETTAAAGAKLNAIGKWAKPLDGR